MQEYIKPMLPAELSRPFDNEEWLFEKNYGGLRAIVAKSGKEVKIYANKYQLFNTDFPQLVRELSKIPSDFVLDGEIAMHNDNGKPDILKLLNFKETSFLPVSYFAFDLLWVQDQPMLRHPLIKRKEMLKNLLPVNSSVILFKTFVMEFGCDLYETATKENLEGITAKKYDGIYRPGRVTSEWLKVNVRNKQEIYLNHLNQSFINQKLMASQFEDYKEIKHAHD